jgi:hypothetical protein
MAQGITVEVKGPLFKKGNRIVNDVTHQLVQRLVELGEQKLDTTLRPRPSGVYLSVQEARRGQATTGNYRRNINGTVQGLRGKIDDGKVVYGPWLEGVSSRNRTRGFKGYASFRRTSQWIQSRVRPEAKKMLRIYARRLNGV